MSRELLSSIFELINPQLSDEELIVNSVKLETQLEDHGMYSLYIWVLSDERYGLPFKTRFYRLVYGDVEPWVLLSNLVNLRDDEAATEICGVLDSFNVLTKEDWEEMKELTEKREGDEDDYPLPYLRDFVLTKNQSFSVLERPKYMMEGSGVYKFVHHRLLHNYKEPARRVLEDLTQHPGDEENIRVHGPINGYSCKGGCRMFLCCEYEGEEGEGRESWFRANCSECGISIPSYRYCVRKPLIGGGWQGCYCSVDCIPVVDKRCDDEEKSLYRLSIFALEKILEKYGIYERIDYVLVKGMFWIRHTNVLVEIADFRNGPKSVRMVFFRFHYVLFTLDVFIDFFGRIG